VGELKKEHLNLILYGEPDVDQEHTDENNQIDHFEGVIPNLERRYQETDSEYLRQEIEKYMIEKVCDDCRGQRLRIEVLSIKLKGKNIIDITEMTVGQAYSFFLDINEHLKDHHKQIAQPILKEISLRLHYLLEVGLSYLTLNRTTATLAGGEAQRIRLANQLGSGLTGVVYILDEPSIGLHARDHEKLLKTIEELRNRSNTIIVVEHDRETMLRADYLIDMGPGAGERGGEIIFEGTPQEVMNDKQSLTGSYLRNEKIIKITEKRRDNEVEKLKIVGARANNLQNISVELPLNKLICITGVSGSGKSTLIEDTLAVALEKHFHNSSAEPAPYEKLEGVENIDNIINIDQSPIGRTPRSNPATYTGVLSPIRELFASTSEAMQRGYDPSRFSFNLRGGRCENCRGDGQIKVEMNFLPDVYVTCTECRGKRFNTETLEIKYHSKDISEVLNMTVDEALEFFLKEEEVRERLKVLEAVGLGYIHLGQSATTLSGGEAQRIKLAAELSKRETGKTLYILDEPTTGLHFEDIQRLLTILYQLVERGNTVIVIEHNLDVINCADWIVDLGPEGGDQGGKVVAVGTPEEISRCPNSITGDFLKRINKTHPSKV
jgi:excinuclease ABC subunit A